MSIDEMQFGFVSGGGAIDTVCILRGMQEENHAKGRKLYMCFVDLDKVFDRVSRKVLEWAMRKTEIPIGLVRSMMSVHEIAMMRVREDYELSEEFEDEVGMLQGSLLSPFVFAVVVDVVTEFA